MATNKVVYGNTTLIDLTGDTAEASDVASGKIFHNKAGVQQTGTGTIVTPTIITPSNSSPASMSANGIYKPTASGYAVASNPISLAPSNSSPPSITDNEIYKTSGNGYAIQSYGNVTPSADGTYFASGFRKMSSSGYAYSSKPTVIGLVCSEKIISNKSTQTKYTLNFSTSISSGNYLLFEIRWPDHNENTRYSTKVLKYTGSGNYSLNSIYVNTTDGPVTLDCTIGSSYITLTHYSGSFQNIYMAIYNISSIFT